MEKVSPEARGYVLGLLAQGVKGRPALRQARKEFPAEKNFPASVNFMEWVNRPGVQEEIEQARHRLREQATERSFADTRQQIHALVTTAERLFSLFLDTPDKETLALIRLNGELRETFKGIREAASPFATISPDVQSAFEQFKELEALYEQHKTKRPEKLQERLN